MSSASPSVEARARWIPCSGCEEYWCRAHDRHASECPCPEIEVFADRGIDPYREGG